MNLLKDKNPVNTSFLCVQCISPSHNRKLPHKKHLMRPVQVFIVFCGVCLPPLSQSKAVELSAFDMVCGLSVLEAAIQRRTGQLSRRVDRLTGVNSTGFRLIQTSPSLQCSKNRWLMLIYHRQPHVHVETNTQTHH